MDRWILWRPPCCVPCVKMLPPLENHRRRRRRQIQQIEVDKKNRQTMRWRGGKTNVVQSDTFPQNNVNREHILRSMARVVKHSPLTMLKHSLVALRAPCMKKVALRRCFTLPSTDPCFFVDARMQIDWWTPDEKVLTAQCMYLNPKMTTYMRPQNIVSLVL